MPGQIKNREWRRGNSLSNQLFQMMSGVRVRSFVALGIVLAVVARGVDGRIGCYRADGNYYVADTDKCWVDTMNKRFGGDEKLMGTCSSRGLVSCCSGGVGYTMCSPRCVGTDAHSDVLVCARLCSTHLAAFTQPSPAWFSIPNLCLCAE